MIFSSVIGVASSMIGVLSSVLDMLFCSTHACGISSVVPSEMSHKRSPKASFSVFSELSQSFTGSSVVVITSPSGTSVFVLSTTSLNKSLIALSGKFVSSAFVS
jgi:hypothetical protein